MAEGVQGSSILCLDMGEWHVPGLNAAEALCQAPPPADGKPSLAALMQAPSGRLAPSPALLAAASDPSLLRVYSVLPPSLAERARVWGGALSLKPGWHQTDRGFFDAPGAVAATLTAGDVAQLEGMADMPPVTMVFAAVEGAKALARARRDGELRQLAAVLRATLLATLEVVPGGYLCREQENDLKYMVSFSGAAEALQWCMLVQEALMYAPWPPGLLELPELAEVGACGGWGPGRGVFDLARGISRRGGGCPPGLAPSWRHAITQRSPPTLRCRACPPGARPR